MENNTQTLAERLESALRDGGWKDIKTAPTNGDSILLWIEHYNYKYTPVDGKNGWAACVVGRWTDHNSGGWIYHGINGMVRYWRPLLTTPGESDPLVTLIRELMEVVRRQEEVIKKGADFCFADALDKTCSSQDAARLWLPVKRAFKQTLAETAPLLAAMEKVK